MFVVKQCFMIHSTLIIRLKWAKHPCWIRDKRYRQGQKEEGGDGTKREAESPRTTVEAKMVMGPNEKQKSSAPPRGLRRRKMRG